MKIPCKNVLQKYSNYVYLLLFCKLRKLKRERISHTKSNKDILSSSVQLKTSNVGTRVYGVQTIKKSPVQGFNLNISRLKSYRGGEPQCLIPPRRYVSCNCPFGTL